MESKAYALWTGVFMLILIATLIAVIVWMSNKGEKALTEYQLIAKESVSGLNREAPVLYRGIQIGRVTVLDIDPKNMQQVIIKIGIRSDLKLSLNSYAKLVGQGITGLTFIELNDPGGALITDPKKTIIPVYPSILQQVGIALPEAIVEFKKIGGQLNQLLDDQHQKHIQEILSNVSQASKQLPELSTQAQQVLTNGKQLTEQMQTLLGQTEKKLAALDQLGQAAQTIKEAGAQAKLGLGTINDQVLPEFNHLLQQATQISSTLKNIVEEQLQNPKQLFFGSEAILAGPGEDGFEKGKPSNE